MCGEQAPGHSGRRRKQEGHLTQLSVETCSSPEFSRDIPTPAYHRKWKLMRSIANWRLRARTMELVRRTLVMGVVNITPDSFSDGGVFLSPEAAVARCMQCLD